MNKFSSLIAFALAVFTPAVLALSGATVPARGADLATVTVWKNPMCGCCGKWVEHLRAAGFRVEVNETARMSVIKRRLSVPEGMASCHTARVAGYVIEGHVPAGNIKKLLKQKPAVAGLAVPGMPIGSPGMEVESGETEAFSVYAFSKAGGTTEFAKHGPK